MLINWPTVAAQVINFLILVWLLKRYLYKPILDSIDKREGLIASQIKEAAEAKIAAKHEQQILQQKNSEIEAQRATVLRAAVDDAAPEKGRILSAAQSEIDALRAKEKSAIKSEGEALTRDIAQRTQARVFDITRKTLADLASATLEERMVEVFLHRARDLSIEDKSSLISHQPATIKSTFALDDRLKCAIKKSLKETLNFDVSVKFEIVPDLICGIELTVNGRKLAWSVSDYLKSLDSIVSTQIRGAGAMSSATLPPTDPQVRASD